jgi:hypothetical protein
MLLRSAARPYRLRASSIVLTESLIGEELMRNPKSLLLVALFCVLLTVGMVTMGTPSARADGFSLLTAEASGGGAAISVADTSNFFLTSQSLITIPSQTGEVSLPQNMISASGAASGSVDFGSLSGSVSGAATGGGNGFGTYTGAWEDTLTITSNTLPVGTPVNLIFSLSVDTTMSCSGVGSTVGTTASMSSTRGGNIALESATCNSTLAKTGTALVQTSVGDSFFVEGELDLTAENTLAGTASVDPSSGFFIDSETAGASYTTASGISYATPPVGTPEPSSLLTLGVGLLGLAGLALKRSA